MSATPPGDAPPPRGPAPDPGADAQPPLDAPLRDTQLTVHDPPPFLGSWRKVYIFVLVSQAIVIILLAIFGEVAG